MAHSDLMTSQTPVQRRRLLMGMGLTGIGGVAALASASPASAVPGKAQRLGTTSATSGNLTVLAPGDDWAATLAATPHVQLVPGAIYTLDAPVELPANAWIEGNGAVLMSADGSSGALSATSKAGITLRNITFQGRSEDPLNTAPDFGHVAVRLTRCTGFRILDCDFNYWLGAGIAVTGAAADDYFSYRGHVQGNNFNRCYFGVSFADRGEYSLLTNNIFTSNRLAIWNSSGNLTAEGNVTVNCYGAYYAFAAPSPYGTLAADNWNHGSLVSNTFNHSNGSGGPRWTANSAFPIAGVSTDPGAGVVVNGVIPPTFTGNTLWYTNIQATNHGANQWLLTGCALSNLSITCSGANPVKILGYQSNGAANVPVLSGNVQHLF